MEILNVYICFSWFFVNNDMEYIND